MIFKQFLKSFKSQKLIHNETIMAWKLTKELILEYFDWFEENGICEQLEI
ncbi:hypothetical protein [Clostridium coskatii]|nr:hypothetical protein [Clostridium coskatii]